MKQPPPAPFTIRYDRALLQRTLDAWLVQHVKQGLGALGLFALALVVAALIWDLSRGEPGWLTGAMGALLLLGVAALIAIRRAWRVALERKLKAMREPRALVTLSEEELALKTDTGGFSLRWDQFTDLREFPGCWLLVAGAPNNFISLPTAGVDPAALDFIRARLGATQATLPARDG